MRAGQGWIGVVTGYRAEADCLHGLGLQVACSGADAQRARAAALRLVGEGARGLISFGLAGGLAPHLQPGDLLLPETVILPDLRRLDTDPAWRARLAASLPSLDPHDAAIAGSDRLVATSAAKRALFEACGAVAVDMESYAVAEVAAKARLPFLVVRAIADRCDQAIPRAAHQAIDANGEVRPLAVLGGLARRPWQMAALIALGRSSGRGLASLRRVAALAPGLGFA
ncbi:MAG: nucleoside phosphorylase [Geminicoccales bacterium]